MNIIDYLEAIGYDYLPLCNADGIHDDSRIKQMRMDAGLDPSTEHDRVHSND